MRNCDLCGSPGTPLAQKPAIHVCNNCGFLFVPERRSPMEIADAWSEIYRSGAYDPNWPGVRARLFYVAEWLDQNIGLDGKTVLDIGAGTGFFLEQVKARGGHPVGLEPDPENRKRIMSKDIECFLGSTETVEHPGQYDIVTINWTLENCGDCIGMLEYARKALAPEGVVCVATGSRILVPFKKPLHHYLGEQAPDLHCFRWSYASLASAFYRADLRQFKSNDFEERDELVVLARSGGLALVSGPPNRPEKVHAFFSEWSCTWP